MATEETVSRMMIPPTMTSHDAAMAADMAELRARRQRETEQLKADCKETSDRLDALEDKLDATFKQIAARLDKLEGGPAEAGEKEAELKKTEEKPPGRNKRIWL